ncbi:MAG: O-antigen ligase [Sphingobium sp.]
MAYEYFADQRKVNFTKFYRVLCQIAIVVLVLVTTTRLTPLPVDTGTIQMTGEGSMLRPLLLILCTLAILVASQPFAKGRRSLRIPVSLIVILGWCVLSVSWSATPSVALRRLIMTLMIVWCIFKSIEMLGYRHFLRLMLYICIGLLIANYIAVGVSPRAMHQSGEAGDPLLTGAWRGILPHKNLTGPLCTFTLFLLVFGVRPLSIFVRIGLIVASAFFLLQTNSKTSIALSVVAIAGGYMMKAYNPRMRILVAPLIGIFAALVAYGVDMLLPAYLDNLDSSTDAFTGRIQIWRSMLRYISDNPFFGAGFSSFWDAGASGPISHYATEMWILTGVAEGHNGYLDVTVQLGLIGLVLALGAIFVIPLMKLIFELGIPDNYRALMFAVLFFSIGVNFTETSLLATDQFMQFVLMANIACIEDMRMASRNARRASFLKWAQNVGHDIRLMFWSARGRIIGDDDKAKGKGHRLIRDDEKQGTDQNQSASRLAAQRVRPRPGDTRR